jgi:hypothetical protein
LPIICNFQQLGYVGVSLQKGKKEKRKKAKEFNQNSREFSVLVFGSLRQYILSNFFSGYLFQN